jgi:hypothetical protein
MGAEGASLFVRTFLSPPCSAAPDLEAPGPLPPLLSASHARDVAALLLHPPRWHIPFSPAAPSAHTAAATAVPFASAAAAARPSRDAEVLPDDARPPPHLSSEVPSPTVDIRGAAVFIPLIHSRTQLNLT